LNKRDWQLLRVIAELWRQQNQMYQNKVHSIEDRIVSIYQPHVRPIPRGKDKATTEFGSKQLVMQKDGYTHVYKIGWDNYNEAILLERSVEAYKSIYGCYPAAVSADRIFGNRTNRTYLKEKGIRFIGKALGRPAALSNKEKKGLQKEMAGRNAIEGKFGQGKNAYGLAKIKARLKNTSESWIMAIYFVMNLLKLAQASFLSFLVWFCSPLWHFIRRICSRKYWLLTKRDIYPISYDIRNISYLKDFTYSADPNYTHVYTPLRNQDYGSLTAFNRAIEDQLLLLNYKPYKNTAYGLWYNYEQHEKSLLKPLPYYQAAFLTGFNYIEPEL